MEIISGNVFIRPIGGFEGLTPGERIEGHVHNFDHTTVFFNGFWRAEKWVEHVNDKGEPGWARISEIEREAPFHLLIEAKAKHSFTFLGGAERGRAWCIYSHRSPQGDVLVDYGGWTGAYQ